MTQLRVQRKPTPEPRPSAAALGPMALILIGGTAASLSLGSGRLSPHDAVNALAEAWAPAFATARQAVGQAREAASALLPHELPAPPRSQAQGLPGGEQEIAAAPPPLALPLDEFGPAQAAEAPAGAVPMAREAASALLPDDALVGPRWQAQVLRVGERDWIAADHPPVAFPPDEVVIVQVASQLAEDAPAIVANKARGLAALSALPGPYDRLYLQLDGGRYQPLRWRQRP